MRVLYNIFTNFLTLLTNYFYLLQSNKIKSTELSCYTSPSHIKILVAAQQILQKRKKKTQFIYKKINLLLGLQLCNSLDLLFHLDLINARPK